MLSRLRTWYVCGMRDSPMWKRGPFSRSNRWTRRPFWATRVEAVEPAGPPPMTMTSVSRGRIVDIAVPGYAARARQGDLEANNKPADDSCPDNYCRNDVDCLVIPRLRGVWG